MFLESFDFLWTPQRPARTMEEVEGALEGLSPADIDAKFSFEDRVAVRSLLHCVIDDTNLRNVLDGVLLPPPYSLLDLSDRRWCAADLKAIVSTLDPALDGLVAQVPFNLALRLGAYDARLRAACRRLCWVLNIPFDVIEAREEAVAAVRLTLQEGEGEGDTAASTGAAASASSAAGREKQGEIAAHKEHHKRSLKRAATVGGFAVLGGAALVLTGGLVAPLIAPALAALVTATAATFSAVGAIGTAVLGTTALAGIFTAVVGIGTHAAALASLLTPVLTAANVTAIFGVSGATLAGYKAMRRTGDSDTFAVRSIDEIETFTVAATTERDDPADATVRTLVEGKQAVEKDQPGVLGTTLDLASVVEDGSKPGFVVPSHTRSVAMGNVANMRMIKKRNRRIVFGLESALPGYELRLKAIKLISGLWGVAPPAAIPAGSAAICACMNRYMLPTGTGFLLCYVAQPVSTRGGSAAFRLWVRVGYDFLGAWEFSSFCEGIDREFDPFKAEMRLETAAEETGYTRSVIGVTMEMHHKPFTYLKVYPASARQEHARKVTFPVEELPQRQLEYTHDVKQRRKVAVSFVNNSRHQLRVVSMEVVNGAQWVETASPMVIDPREASLTFFTNASWSLEGAEGFYILEVANHNEPPLTRAYYVRVQFEISAMNNLNVAVVAATTSQELRQMELTPASPESNTFDVPVKDGLFCRLSVRVLPEAGVVQLHCKNAVERDRTVPVVQKASLAIGVCGYSAVFDARRPLQDQQVGLWQGVLRSSRLLGRNEGYALQWEDEYLLKFSETVKVDFQVADQVGKKALSKAKSVAKKQLMQGVIFSGFRAFNALLGAIDLPLYAIWASDVIDNTFATLSNRAVFAGKDLAAALLDPARGNRPVTLVGFSFGSKVIAECLKELVRVEALGIVENAYLLGSTISADCEEWQCLRRGVAGRLVNVYTRSDWALWLMYKANEGELKPMAGISPVAVPGVENVDASGIVQQQAAYAAHLGDVLSLIPACPTEETWSRKSLRGSPGVVVPTTAYKKVARTMGGSLSSVLSSTPYSAFALRNSVVTDVPEFYPTLELVAVSTFNCFFDFLPPPAVGAGCAGVWGAVGEESGQPIGGVFSFRLRLDPFSERDVLLLVPFYVEKNNDVYLTVRPSLVTQHSTKEETEEEADSRFYTIATETITSLEDAKANTADLAPASTVVTPQSIAGGGGGAAVVSFEVPLTDIFLDGHRSAVFHVALGKIAGGVSVNFLALLLKAASQLQQEKFDEDTFIKKYAKDAEAAAGAALGDDGQGLPSIAQIESIDHFQSTLFGIANDLREKTSSEGTGEHGPTPATSESVRRVGEAYIVVTNCGTTSLYFGEEAYAQATALLDDGSAGEDLEAPSPYASRSAAASSISSSRLRRQQQQQQQQLQNRVQWLRFPPSEIPPQSFCVLSVARFDESVFPRLRYETADGVCAFDIAASASTYDSPRSSFASAPADVASAEVASRLVLCSVVAPLQATGQPPSPSRGPPVAAERVGEVSTSTTVIHGVRFHLVLMTPRSSGGGKSFANQDAEDAEVKTALKSYGWYIA